MSGRDIPHLVGRDRETALLNDNFDQMLAGRGGVVLVSGDAGIGKTALVNVLSIRAEDAGAAVYTGACYDLQTTPPFGPWTDANLIPPLDDGDPIGEVGEIAASIVKTAEQGPTLLVLEDLHWTDPESTEILRTVARHADQTRLLLVATYRDREIEPSHPLYSLLPLLVRESQAGRISLTPLRIENIKNLVDRRYGLASEERDRLAGHLHNVSAGIPLFVEEQLRALEENRALTAGESGWKLGDLRDSEIPMLIQQVLGQGLARFSDDQRQLLGLAAVIGYRFTFRRWTEISQAQPDKISDLIGRAIRFGVLLESRERADLHFGHAVIREFIYSELTALERQQLHVQVAEYLIEQSPPDLEQISHHLERADDPRAIHWLIASSEQAFRKAARTTAANRIERAVRMMDDHGEAPKQRAIALGRLAWLREYSDPNMSRQWLDEAMRIAHSIDDQYLFASLLALRGELLSQTVSMSAGIADMQRARNIFARIEPEASELQPVIRLDFGTDDPAFGLLQLHAMVGNFRAAVELALDPFGIDVYGELPPSPHPADAVLSPLSSAVAELGRPDLAPALLERALAAYASTGDYLATAAGAFWNLACIYSTFLTDRTAEISRLVLLAEEGVRESEGAFGVWHPRLMALDTMMRSGAWTEIERLAEPALPGRVPMLGRQYLASNMARIALYRGDAARVWELVDEVIPDGAHVDPGDSFFVPTVPLTRVAFSQSLRDDDLTGAEEWLAAHQRWIDWSGSISARPWQKILQSELAIARENPVDAARHAQRAIELALSPRQPPALLQAHRLYGDLATRDDHYAEARRHLGASLSIAQSIQDRYEIARTNIALARLSIASGQSQEARPLLEGARTELEQLGATPTLSQIDELDAAPEFHTGPILTQREVEVLRLVAAGLTNAEIAEDLFISRHTVDHHLRSIYRKVDVRSRAAATRYALEHDLA